MCCRATRLPDGGGAYCGTLYNCIADRQLGCASGGGASGGTLNNCTLSGNSASYGGGAYGGTLYHCTLSGNSASDEWRWGVRRR